MSLHLQRRTPSHRRPRRRWTDMLVCGRQDHINYITGAHHSGPPAAARSARSAP